LPVSISVNTIDAVVLLLVPELSTVPPKDTLEFVVVSVMSLEIVASPE
jgi:hypothetical protein